MSASSTFAKECLKAHNDKRTIHGVSKLKLSSELSVLAENWAKHLITTGALAHSKHEYKGAPLGENIAGKSSSGEVTPYTGEEVTDQWYSEIKDYDFRSHSTGVKTGHFSQVVWKDTKEMGVGIAVKDGKCIVVANYYPAGNFVGMYSDNVPPPSKKASSKGKARKDSSSSSDDEKPKRSDDHRACKPKAPTGHNTSFGTSKVTVTKTITKPDGTVETITEERVEENTSPRSLNDSQFAGKGVKGKCAFKQSTSDFQKDALDTHNKLRTKHKSPKLKLNSQLCDIAQSWAEHLASIATLQHSNNKHKGDQLGENVASRWGSVSADYTGEEVTMQWYNEEPAYDYSGKSNAGKSGHFSQVVWKASEELGIGKAADDNGRVYVVANYKPAGNYIGNFVANVKKP